MKMFLEIFSGNWEVDTREERAQKKKKKEERSGLVKRSFKNTVFCFNKNTFLIFLLITKNRGDLIRRTLEA